MQARFGIGHQVQRRQHVGGHAALVVADVAAHRLAIGQRLGGNLRGQQGLHHVAAPHAVRRRNHDAGGVRSGRHGFGSEARNGVEFVFGQRAFQHNCLTCDDVFRCMERNRLHGGVGKQFGRSCSPGCASVARGQLDILRSFVRVHELVQACGIGVAVIDLHAGGAVAGDGERFGRHQAGKQL